MIEEQMHLTAARSLAGRIPADLIARMKTHPIIGDSCDFRTLELGEDGDVTEYQDGTAQKRRLLKQHMLAEAKSFRELEALIEALDFLETAASLAGIQHE